MKRQNSSSRTRSLPGRLSLWACLVLIHGATISRAQPDPNWLAHDRDRPLPKEVDPGTASTQAEAGRPPSDAVILFDGEEMSQWVSMDGSPTQWIAKDGYMECVKGSGYIRTLRNFGDCQLHVEWAAPTPASGEGQGRGNSGVFFGLNRYEVQVLDSYQNKTYADGSAGSIYGQYPPLVNASRPPGQWQNYDIVYQAPRFDTEGNLIFPAYLTVFHNGVLIQYDEELTGPTSWLQRAPYSPHPEKQPIALQDHGNPVRFRNIWVRELGPASKPEYTLADSLLKSYVGLYEIRPDFRVEVALQEQQLTATFQEVTFLLFAESPTKFFAKTTDVQVEFKSENEEAFLMLSVGEGGFRAKKIKPPQAPPRAF